jgi:hypothetical protein
MWELFFEAAWRVTVAGLVFGAGLVVLFALGVRSMVLASGAGAQVGVRTSLPPAVNRMLGVLCFALVLIGVAVGILIIVGAGLGLEVSFDHIFPTLQPKS